ncbi:hypothetical protein BKA62DRAFT_121732 [Auriculariales sp. MPI-PUGE-AT-0066]|nr:hypothetical protein BKA62DRAFT_121732 [Auriculariales sp. MPI-PUGE-AT-0066]
MSINVVTSSINYFTPPTDGSQPWGKAEADPTTGEQQTNWERDPRQVQIENVRGCENEYELDTAGFSYHKRPTALTASDFDSDATIKERYYPESIEYLKEVTGARKVILYSHTIRCRRPREIDSDSTKRQPLQQAHGDQTLKSATRRVHRHLPAQEAEEFLASGRRFQIINLWRPIGNPALDFPLALCDFRSIDQDADLFPHKIYFAKYEGETLAVRHSDRHQWKYLRGQTPEEFILIKCFDSDPKAAFMTAHTAFIDPTTPKDAPKRQSIELRALVFY